MTKCFNIGRRGLVEKGVKAPFSQQGLILTQAGVWSTCVSWVRVSDVERPKTANDAR